MSDTDMGTDYDVAVIGGGPGGSTIGTMLKKYAPDLNVVIFEREKFPRDHVGESQLPAVCQVLDEMGCWDKVEAAGFPIKIGATYKWGETEDLWDFEFYPAKEFKDEPRPAKYKGQRMQTAFQVDRANYDKILLDHAAEMGCEVREETSVKKVLTEDGRVAGFELDDGSVVTARYYIDSSGAPAIMRRTLGIEVEQPGNLQNVAFWDYWQNTEWAVEIGVGATRVQVMSLPWGWLWFIPLGPTRTSIGLVCPAEYYKSSGMKPNELYHRAVQEEPVIAKLVKNAKCEENFATTRDWSYVAERVVGPNWFIIGEASGFADPILAAGLTLTHASAREAAFTIIELDRGETDGEWLRWAYEDLQQTRLRQHIQFADYWYTAKGSFPDLKDLTRNIAAGAGLDLDANAAFQWLGTGGFVDHGFDRSGFGSFSIFSIKSLADRFAEKKSELMIATNNVFKLDIGGCERVQSPIYRDGRVEQVTCYKRGNKTLGLSAINNVVVQVLRRESKAPPIETAFRHIAGKLGPGARDQYYIQLFEALEALVRDGFVKASYNKNKPLLDFSYLEDSDNIHTNVDNKDVANT